jgi:hypothetical protein
VTAQVADTAVTRMAWEMIAVSGWTCDWSRPKQPSPCVRGGILSGRTYGSVRAKADHTVEALLRTYTHCLDQGEHEALP